MGNEWEKIGEVGVGSGLCWIGDPSYVLEGQSPGLYYDALLRELHSGEGSSTKAFDFPGGNPGLGVVSVTGLGDDGLYEVSAGSLRCRFTVEPWRKSGLCLFQKAVGRGC